MALFPWQGLVNEGIFAVKPTGEWAASEVGLLVARQNGKSEILIGYLLAHLILFKKKGRKPKLILYTAHELKTTQEIYIRTKAIIESLATSAGSGIEKVYEGNGNWTIVMKRRPGQESPDTMRFMARSRNAARGFAADVIVCDEAQELSKGTYNALTYTQTTIANRQIVYTGTVPEDGINESEIFEGVRDRGREGNPSTCWYEWSPEGSEDLDLAGKIDFSDAAVRYSANPSMADGLFGMDVVGEQYDRDISPGRESFGRERLSIWPARPEVSATGSASDLDMAVWRDQIIQARLGSGVVLAVALGRGGGFSTIGGAQRLDDGRILVEHLDTRVQTRWVPAALEDLKRKHDARLIVLDEKNCAPIISDLRRLGLRFMAMNMNEVAAAFDLFIEHSNAGDVVHPDQEELALSLEHAVPRVMNKAQQLKTWDQGDPSEPVTQAQAVTLALWGVKKFESRPAPPPSTPPAAVKSAGDGSGEDLGRDLLNVRF